ncbi:MAG TPA: aminotransferase class I/II-fold pyridoxal phosphate-dependent enzyme, partial [Candidatus Bathyarchaeota archaeon]|nr:aminotransferase class I/II-fold pyridoxal phosphate-dependent enzyme [Candidatus Bathyarchaeota archaeon]
MHVAKRAFRVRYAIREILPYAEELERKGIKVIRLNIGDPVPYGFQPPEYFREALKKAVDEGFNGYAPSTGLDELKEEIAKKERKYNGVEIRDPRNDILITQGLSEAIFTVIAATAEEGDEVLLPGPAYPSYIAYTNFMGAKPVFYRNIEEEGWVPDLDDVRKKITDRTRLIVLINPNNPTGAVIREKYVKEMVNIAAEHEIPIVSDEIYDLIVFDGLKTPSAAAVAGEHPVIGFNGFSKVFLLTGWRLGYIYFYDPED